MSTNLSLMPVIHVNPYGVHMGFFPILVIVLIALLLISHCVGKSFDIYKDRTTQWHGSGDQGTNIFDGTARRKDQRQGF